MRSPEEIANDIVQKYDSLGGGGGEQLLYAVKDAIQSERRQLEEAKKEREENQKHHSVIEARLFAEKKVLEATVTSLEDDRTDQELKISNLQSQLLSSQMECGRMIGLLSSFEEFINGCFEHDRELVFHRNDFGGFIEKYKKAILSPPPSNVYEVVSMACEALGSTIEVLENRKVNCDVPKKAHKLLKEILK